MAAQEHPQPWFSLPLFAPAPGVSGGQQPPRSRHIYKPLWAPGERMREWKRAPVSDCTGGGGGRGRDPQAQEAPTFPAETSSLFQVKPSPERKRGASAWLFALDDAGDQPLAPQFCHWQRQMLSSALPGHPGVAWASQPSSPAGFREGSWERWKFRAHGSVCVRAMQMRRQNPASAKGLQGQRGTEDANLGC